MTKEEWIDRCREQFMSRGGVGFDIAQGMAEACLEDQQGLEADVDPLDPEEAADEEMSLWDEPIEPQA